MTIFIAGFSLGLSLIVAIGSQNAFVLKQGLRNQYVFWVCLICALSDSILISAGVAGFGFVVKQYPQIEVFARYGGAVFLTIYGLLNLKAALTETHSLEADADRKDTLPQAILMCMAFTWLNPHVYLDTVVLLGSISTQYEPQQWTFAAGALTASFLFFFSLGYGAKALAPVFAKPVAWKVLDWVIGITMLVIAYSLVNR